MPASGPSLSGIAEIKALNSSQIADRTILWDSSIRTEIVPYVYNASSSAAADDNLVLMPADNPVAGRWQKSPAASPGGGGSFNFDFSQINAQLSTMPAIAGAEGEVRHVVRHQAFQDLSAFGGSDTRIQTPYHGLVGCTIKRSAVWQYSTALTGGFGGEWFAASVSPIEIVVASSNGVAVTETLTVSPEELKIKADVMAQVAYVWYYNTASTGEKSGWTGWRAAKMSDSPELVPVGASGAPYWLWLNIGANSYNTYDYTP